MLVREAAYADTENIFALYEQARAVYRSALINQWNDGRPDFDDIFGDIDDGICYTVTDNSRTVAAFVCDFSGETDYSASIGADWHDGEYAVVHRIAVASEADAQATIACIAEFVTARCRENGVQSIRSGAHPKDERLLTAMQLGGFEPCGRYRTASGEERTALRIWIE